MDKNNLPHSGTDKPQYEGFNVARFTLNAAKWKLLPLAILIAIVLLIEAWNWVASLIFG